MRFLIATLAAMALTTPAHAFLAKNDLIVEPAGGDTFRVPYRGLSAASDFWCAAGDYAIRKLHVSPDTRIYRLSSPPRRSGQGITFSLSSEGAQRPGLALISDSRGLTAAHARSFCDARQIFIFN